jgi:uncharacterized protein YutD
MKKKGLFMYLICACLVACALDDDYDLSGYDYVGGNWTNEIMHLVGKYNDVLDKSDVELLSFKKVSNKALDITFFFNEMTVIPVYLGGLDRFELFPYSVAEKDTFSLHFRVDYLKDRVDSILDNTECDIVKLEWSHKGDKFNTFALFNANTGELEYDNILFNLFRMETINGEKKKLLTRGEGGNGNNVNDHYELTCFYNRNDEIAAYAWSRWIEIGHWNESNIYDSTNVIGKRYTYVHDRLDQNSGSWSLDNNMLSAFTVFRDSSNTSCAKFKKYTYVGPKAFVPSNNAPLNENMLPNTTLDLSYTALDDRWFGCIVKVKVDYIQIMPTKPDYYY